MSLFFDEPEGAAPVGGTGEELAGRPPRRGLRVLASLAVIALAALGGAGLWLWRQVDPPGPPGEDVALTVPEGATGGEVADDLEAAGVITDSRLFRLWLRLQGSPPLQAGEYTLRRRSSIGEAYDALAAGPVISYTRVTVPEGLTVAEVAEAVDRHPQLTAERFVAAVRSGEVRSRFQPDGVSSLEGLLYPETYTLTQEDTERVLLERMVAAMDGVAGELGYGDAEQRVGLSPYETLVVASLVEAEARVDEDRAKIARVIHNRLAEGMPLEIDATVYYALGRRGGSLTRSDLGVDSPYNTRRRAGLPPTPIAIPGRASLEAAINPQPGSWLFYVLADESGVHAFSEDYDQFLRDKAAAAEKGLL